MVIDKFIGTQISTPIEAIGNVLDKLFTSDEERETLAIAKERLYQNAAIVQAEINKIEAQHRSIFVAGWRPFIGWVCGFALLWHFIGFDFMSYIATLNNLPLPPKLNGTEDLITIVISLLGLGVYRTMEKLGGRAK